MRIYTETPLAEYEAVGEGAKTLSTLTDNEILQLEAIIEDIYNGEIGDVELNDLLSYETDWIAEALGYRSWEELTEDRDND